MSFFIFALFLVYPSHAKILVARADNTYSFVTKWGSFGNYDGLLNVPASIALDSSGNVYVTDTNNNRIEKFSGDGKFLAKWGSEGTGEGQFNGPRGIAVDSMGNVYVTDTGNGRVEKFTCAGNFIAQFGSQGVGDGKFDSPSGVAVDSM